MSEFSVTTSALEEFIELVKGDRNPITNSKWHSGVPEIIVQRWKEFGANATLLPFKWYGFEGKNIWVPPPDAHKDFILLMAHHDTVPNCPGVDDNGSGMAIVDQILSWYYQNLGKTLDNYYLNLAFLMTDFEEGDPRIFQQLNNFRRGKGYNDMTYVEIYSKKELHNEFISYLESKLNSYQSYIGANEFLLFLVRKKLHNKLDIIFNFETVGYISSIQKNIAGVNMDLEKGDFLAIAINSEAKKWVGRIKNHKHSLKTISLPVANQGQFVPGSRLSDHSVFWDKGIDAAMFTDTAFYRNPNYHKPSDIEVDYEFMKDITEYSISLLCSTK